MSLIDKTRKRNYNINIVINIVTSSNLKKIKK